MRVVYGLMLFASFAQADLKVVPPITVISAKNYVISNVRVSNPKGDCITLQGASNVKIINSEIGPCGGRGVLIDRGAQVLISNNYIHNTGLSGVTFVNSNDVTALNNRFETVGQGVKALSSTLVDIEYNKVLNVQGEAPNFQGNIVQLDKVTGAGIRINCNVGDNIAGKSAPEDLISLYMSSGIVGDPIQVIGNRLRGGGPSTSGGGIMTGDVGGNYERVQDNLLINPGQYGIAVASGSNITVTGNEIYSNSFPFSNVGIYAWNQYLSQGYGCSSIEISSNTVYYLNKKGSVSPYWDAGNCGTISGVSTNKFAWNVSPVPVLPDFNMQRLSCVGQP
jgi:parallel beta-helix repeat protein